MTRGPSLQALLLPMVLIKREKGAVTLTASYRLVLVLVTLAMLTAHWPYSITNGSLSNPETESYVHESAVSEFQSRRFAVRHDGREVALSLDGDIWLLNPDLSETSWTGRLPLGTELARATWGGQTASDYPLSRWVHRLPTWLPDNRLLYLRSALPQNPNGEGPMDRELWVTGSGAPRRLTDLPHSISLLLPDPKGERLLCLGGSDSNSPNGYLSMIDLRTGALLSLKLNELPAAPVEAVWSPDGKILAIAVPKENWLELFSLEVATGSIRRLTGFSTATGPLTPPAMTWPPGADSLYLHAWEPEVRPGTTPSHGGVWLVPVGGGDPIQVAEPHPGLSSPQWSPDGIWIAYHNSTDGYRYALHVSSGRSTRLGGWSRQEPNGIPFQWEQSSRRVWYPCPTGLCRITLPTAL